MKHFLAYGKVRNSINSAWEPLPFVTRVVWR